MNPPASGHLQRDARKRAGKVRAPGPFQVVITTDGAGQAVVVYLARVAIESRRRFDEWGASEVGLAVVLLVCVMLVGIDSRRRQ